MFKFLLVFLFSSSSFAGVHKVLAVHPISAEQVVLTINDASPLDASYLIIWDESHDGALPVLSDYSVVSKSGNSLITDSAKVTAKAASDAAKAAKVQDASDRQAALKALITKARAKTLTNAEIQEIVRQLLIALYDQ